MTPYGSTAVPGSATPACGLPELWQAEWCPHSQRVRNRLTELGVDFVARQVPADRECRAELMELAGCETVPVLVTPDSETIRGTDAILDWLETHYAEGSDAAAHRRKAIEKHQELLDRECNCNAA